jgi:hypothetical protein
MRGALIVWALSAALHAQAPAGAIAGTVTDPSGAVVPGVKITISDKSAGLSRALESNSLGNYLAASLPAGEYELRADAPGLRTLLRGVTVTTGSTTTANLEMVLGERLEAITVESAAGQISYDSHAIEGLVTRHNIEDLPLNGRSFLNLALLQPGVVVTTGNPAQLNSLFNVSVMGGHYFRTAITVDGGDVRNFVEGSTGTNFSQEVVQEFQLSSVNFDLSTGITSIGAINIVTRSGTNSLHGAGYFTFRDHNLAAYPGLARNPLAPDPFFARRTPGFSIEGPLRKNKLFAFFNYEYTNQTGVFIVNPDAPSLAPFSQIAPSPYVGKLISNRLDYRASQNQSIFLRYSHDGNHATGPTGLTGAPPLPSNFVQNRNWSDQVLLGVTSVVSANLVNDFRGSFWYWLNNNAIPKASDCPAACLGLGLPEIHIIGSNFVAGNTINAPMNRNQRRWHLSDGINWQRGAHRFQFGGEYEREALTGSWAFLDPGIVYLYGAELLGQFGLGPAFGLPKTFSTLQDLSKLPVFLFEVGIGNPGQPPPYNLDQAKFNHRTHLYFQDNWRVRPKLNLNYGLGWQFESTLTNNDLSKPAYLAPILGPNGLNPPPRNFKNFSPSLGFAWNVGRDSKTVIRGGAGIYFDTQLLWQKLLERSLLGPVGNGRSQISGAAVPNFIPDVPLVVAPGNLPIGAPLDFQTFPTGFTLGTLLQNLPKIRADLEQKLAPTNPPDLSVRAIQLNKQGTFLFPPRYPTSYGEHLSIGVQRELAPGFVLSADFVSRQFIHQIGDNPTDYNHFYRASGPVIPACTTAAQIADPHANCSTGPIQFWTPDLRSHYRALLVRAEKRLSKRVQFLVSYALADQEAVSDINANLDDWFATYGPSGARHVLNISGLVDLPWKFQLSYLSVIHSRDPFGAYISNVDLAGSGSSYQTLPGVPYNSFNFGHGNEDLARLVNDFNSAHPNVANPGGRCGARPADPRGQCIPVLRLPQNYSLGDSFSSQDVRLSKVFSYRERYQLKVFVEAFNLFNFANLSGFSGDLTNPGFGQPSARIGQVFGSGGPRAFQLGARVSF